MIPEELVIRRMSSREVTEIAVEWASNEGWNPGLYDAKCFYEADRDGFFVALINNEPVACISLVCYDKNFSFLGFYIVKPEYRGKGYGIRLWNFAINEHRSVNIGLDGVIAQQSNYIRSGFKLAYRNIRFQGKAKHSDEEYKNIMNADHVSFKKICEYDRKAFPADRENFLKCWLSQPESHSFLSVENGKITGYGMIRKCRIGFKIGPLFADDDKVARELFHSLINSINEGEVFFLDTPEINENAVRLAEENDMVKVFETARMYTDGKPDIDMKKVFGVTTFELG